MTKTSSEPTYNEFNPNPIPYQAEVIRLMRDYDYSQGYIEILLSGAVGSAKSILAAHIAIDHCLENPGAKIGIARRALPDIKKTIFDKIKKHLGGREIKPAWKWQDTTATVQFANGSEIVACSWADKRYKKFRSLELSGLIIEESTENEGDDVEAITELRDRVGRLPGIVQNFIIHCTNPDEPDHWLYEDFEIGAPEKRAPQKFVFFSKTRDNPFLPSWYEARLRSTMDPMRAKRMLEGLWISIGGTGIYYAYNREKNFSDTVYKINRTEPIFISWDFNIGDGKPMSACLFQYINDHIHVFDEIVVHGVRTLDTCEEVDSRGYLDHKYRFVLTGDATAKHKDTRSKKNDYDIIKEYFANHDKEPKFDVQVYASNGPIRKRHNLVNSYCINANKKCRLTIYAKAKNADKAMQMTKFKKDSYIEDDSKEFQHVGTAIGYGLRIAKEYQSRERTSIVQ